MSVTGVNFSGISSGIDTESIIQQYLKLDRVPEKAIQQQQDRLKATQTAYNSVSAQLLTLQSSADTINRLRAFDLVTATSSDSTVATVSAQTGAQTGDHTITVSNLATTQKISSTAQTSQTAPLGYTGQIVINGKAINVQANDSLQSLANNINAAQPGVVASIISPSANQFYLTLASKNSGLQGQINISDTAGGTFLSGTLGVFGAGTSLRNPISASVAGSALFTDSATSVGTLEGQTAPAAGATTITIGTHTLSVNIDLSTDSLSAIANKINSAYTTDGGTGTAPATIATVTDPISGASKQQLQIGSTAGAASFVDSNNVLANLGIVQRNYGASRELVAAKDATFNIDGLNATRPTNTLTDVVAGVSISLLKDTGTVTVSVGSDTDTIKSNINAFVKAYNDTIDSISGMSQYDASTGATGPLFGDVTAQSIVDNLVSSVSDTIKGAPSSLNLLSQIGISLGTDSKLTVDDTALSNALATNLPGVAQLFRTYGTPTDPTVQFVSATGKTQPTGASGYPINITTPASQATFVAAQAQTSPLAQDELLSFGGSLFGTSNTALSGGRTLLLHQGSSLSDVISEINGDPVLGPLVSASIATTSDPNPGALKIVSKSYGAAAEFTVFSAIPGANDSSGIGTTLQDRKGVNVAGTINGETSVGVGQFLTGSQVGAGGNGLAYGLQIRVTATAPGSYGSITYSNGAANVLRNYIDTQTDVYSGNLTTAVSGLDDNIKDLQSNIDEIEAQVTDTETNLRARFTAMETAVSNLKAAGSSLSQLVGGLSNSSSSNL